MRVFLACAMLVLATSAHAGPDAPGLAIDVCAHGPEAGRALAAARALSAQVEAAEEDPPPAGTLRAALDKVLQRPCMRLAAEANLSLAALDETEVFVDWWRRGGEDWLQSLLVPERVVVPPDPDRLVGAIFGEDPAYKWRRLSICHMRESACEALRHLICASGDRACGRETEGWRTRADAGLHEFARWMKERDDLILSSKERDASAHPIPVARDPGAACTEATRTVPPDRRYTEWRACLDGKVEHRQVMPLGRVRAPTRGWLVLRGRRGHYDFCETLSAYDLATGAAYQTRDCSALQLRSDGSVDGAATQTIAKVTHPRGRVSIDNLREALYAILLAGHGERMHVLAESFALPPGMKRHWVGGETARYGSRHHGGVTSAQTTLAWAWIDGGKPLADGSLTWPSSLEDGIEAHAAMLVEVAEEGLVEGCPPAPLPRDLPLVMPRSERAVPVDNARAFADLAGSPCKAH